MNDRCSSAGEMGLQSRWTKWMEGMWGWWVCAAHTASLGTPGCCPGLDIRNRSVDFRQSRHVPILPEPCYCGWWLLQLASPLPTQPVRRHGGVLSAPEHLGPCVLKAQPDSTQGQGQGLSQGLSPQVARRASPEHHGEACGSCVALRVLCAVPALVSEGSGFGPWLCPLVCQPLSPVSSHWPPGFSPGTHWGPVSRGHEGT